MGFKVGGQPVAAPQAKPSPVASKATTTAGKAEVLKAFGNPRQDGPEPIGRFLGKWGRRAVDVASRPAYGIGATIKHKGDVREGLKATFSGLDRRAAVALGPVGGALAATGALPKGKISGDKVMPGKALADVGALNWVPEKHGLRTAARVAGDIGLDPLTYLALGTTSAGKAAAAQAAQTSIKGGRATLRNISANIIEDQVRRAVTVEAARQAAPRSLSVGARIPFTRGRVAEFGSVPLPKRGTGGRAPAALAFAAPSAGMDPLVHAATRAARHAAAAEAQRVERYMRELRRGTMAIARKQGDKYDDVAKAISNHLDYSATHAAPKGYESIVDSLKRHRVEALEVDKREGVLVKGQVDDYFPHRPADPRAARKWDSVAPPATQGRSNRPTFGEKRAYGTLAEYEAAGLKAITDPFEAFSRRASESARSRAYAAVERSVAERVGLQRNPVPKGQRTADLMVRSRRSVPVRGVEAVQKQLPKGLATLGSPQLKGVKVPQGVIPDLNRAREILIGKPGSATRSGIAAENLGSFFRRVGGRWKALALAYPGFHPRNMIDDSLRAYLEGARSPKSYGEAIKVGRGKGALNIRGEGEVPAAVVQRALANMGVRDSGQVRNEVSKDLVEKVRDRAALLPQNLIRHPGGIKQAFPRELPGTGLFTKANRSVGEARENWMRAGTFLERMKAGDDPYSAALRTMAGHYDYADVSPFVEGARAFATPFITYPSKAIPHALRVAGGRPGFLPNVGKVFSGIEEEAQPSPYELAPGSHLLFGGPRSLGAALPGFPKGETPLLDPERVLFLGSLGMLDPKSLGPSLANILNPLITTPIEGSPLLAGKKPLSIYFGGTRGQQLTEGGPVRVRAPRFIRELQKRGIPVPEYGPYKAPGGQVVPGWSAGVDLLSRLFPPYSKAVQAAGGTADSPSLGLTRFLTGVPVSTPKRQSATKRAGR